MELMEAWLSISNGPIKQRFSPNCGTAAIALLEEALCLLFIYCYISSRIIFLEMAKKIESNIAPQMVFIPPVIHKSSGSLSTL